VFHQELVETRSKIQHELNDDPCDDRKEKLERVLRLVDMFLECENDLIDEGYGATCQFVESQEKNIMGLKCYFIT
jgi:hypothetical protein